MQGATLEDFDNPEWIQVWDADFNTRVLDTSVLSDPNKSQPLTTNIVRTTQQSSDRTEGPSRDASANAATSSISKAAKRKNGQEGAGPSKDKRQRSKPELMSPADINSRMNTVEYMLPEHAQKRAEIDSRLEEELNVGRLN